MARLVLPFLVFVLSGAPAATVVCELVLCAPDSSDASGCHEHRTSGPGMSATENCSHLLVVAPFVSPAPRDVAAGATIVTVFDVSGRHDVHPGVGPHASYTHAHPPFAASPQLHPLRI